MNLYLTILMGVLMAGFTFSQDDEEIYEPLPDYYHILQVAPTAALKDIKRSFRKLAIKFHPDKNKEEGAEERFQELSEAYSILSDSAKRAEYDQLYMDEEEPIEEPDNGAAEREAEAAAPGPQQQAQAQPQAPQRPLQPTKPVDNSLDDSEEQDVSPEWDDLDDETLYKVLRFLADNDYEITKKTTYREIDPVSGERSSEPHTRTKRSSPHREYYNRHGERMDDPWQQDQHHQNHEFRHQDDHYAGDRRHDHYAGDRRHDHYAGDYHQDDRFAGDYHQDDRFAGDYHQDNDGDFHHYTTGQQYARSSRSPTCQTYVRWEGSTKITRKSCH